MGLYIKNIELPVVLCGAELTIYGRESILLAGSATPTNYHIKATDIIEVDTPHGALVDIEELLPWLAQNLDAEGTSFQAAAKELISALEGIVKQCTTVIDKEQ